MKSLSVTRESFILEKMKRVFFFYLETKLVGTKKEDEEEEIEVAKLCVIDIFGV